MPFVHTEEADPHRPELRRRRHPERPARQKAQHLGVELERAAQVHGRQHHMPQTLGPRHEPSAERGHDRAVVEYRAVENLESGAGGIGEGDRLLHPTGIGVGLRQRFHCDPGLRHRLPYPPQRGVVADLPADPHHLVGFPGDHHYPRGPFVHPQIERVLVRPRPRRETEHIEGEPPPSLHIRGLDLYITQALDIGHFRYVLVVRLVPAGQIIERS